LTWSGSPDHAAPPMKKSLSTLVLLCFVAGLMAATAPTLNSVSVLTAGGGGALGDEDTALVVSYALLASAANEFDLDGGTINFRIENIAIGTLAIRLAGTATAGTPITYGTTILSATHELLWTPPSNATGDLPAFTIKAWDGALASVFPVQVTVRVAAVNDPPTLTTIATLTAGGGAPLGDEDTAIIITGPAIFAAADESDVDGTVSAFRIASITGTLGIRALGSVSAATPATVDSLVDATQELVWTPPLNANGVLTACSLRAWDGAANSTTAVAMPVLVNPVIDLIYGSAIQPFPEPVLPIVVGVPRTYTFADLVALTLFTDPDQDARAWIFLEWTNLPTTGWKYERLDASDIVLEERVGGLGPIGHLVIARDEKLRLTVTSALPPGTPNHALGGLGFIHSTESGLTGRYDFIYHVTVGGSAGGPASGGGSGGCGIGGAMAGLIALLGLALFGRRWHA